MKKMLGMALLCALLSPQVFATKARLLALGMDETDNEGSYYIEDNRNIFLNVANINKYGDSVIFEWGDEGASTAGSDRTTTDSDAKPKAGGGFLMNSGDYVWGVYYGNESNTSSMLRIVGSNYTGNELLPTSDNQIDFFVGRELSGINWGLSFVYSKAEDESINSEDTGYAIRLGAMTDKWNFFVNSSIGGESERDGTAFQKFDGSLGLHVGGGYQLNDNGTVYAYVKSFGWDQTDVTTTVEGSFSTYSVGYGHQLKTDAGTLFSNIYFRQKDIEVKFANKAEASNTEVPLTIGYEAEANSWLTLRGSVTQNLYGKRNNDNFSSLNAVAQNVAADQFGADTDGKDATMRDSTTVKAGASLTFGNLVVDGLIGTGTNDSSLYFDEVMSRVGATYSF